VRERASFPQHNSLHSTVSVLEYIEAILDHLFLCLLLIAFNIHCSISLFSCFKNILRKGQNTTLLHPLKESVTNL